MVIAANRKVCVDHAAVAVVGLNRRDRSSLPLQSTNFPTGMISHGSGESHLQCCNRYFRFSGTLDKPKWTPARSLRSVAVTFNKYKPVAKAIKLCDTQIRGNLCGAFNFFLSNGVIRMYFRMATSRFLGSCQSTLCNQRVDTGT